MQHNAVAGSPRPARSEPQSLQFTREELEQQMLFRAVELDPIEPMLRNCPVRTLDAGDVLIAAGDPNRHLYLVLSGQLTVRLKRKDDVPVANIEAGESVGELSLIDRQPVSAFVVAECPCRVLAIDEELMWMLINTSHGVSSNLLYTLVQRMRSGNDVINHDRERLRLYQFNATTDALTGLFNRRWLAQMLPRQINRARFSEQALSLLMVDIDHFKKINDGCGHVAGDQVLAAVSACLRNSLRPADMAARYGGEEFLVILPDTAPGDARIVAERLRKVVSDLTVVSPEGKRLPGVTVSVGIAGLERHKGAEELISCADTALYRAKAAGRDRISD